MTSYKNKINSNTNYIITYANFFINYDAKQ